MSLFAGWRGRWGRDTTTAAGAAAATGTIELTWPMAVVAVAYIAGQTVVDTWGE